MSWQARFTQRAKRDIHEIHAWIRSISSKGAEAWLIALETSIGHLSEFADSSAIAPEADDLGIDLKQRLFKTRRGHSYRLLFIIRDGTVHVLAVRGMGQDLLQEEDIELP